MTMTRNDRIFLSPPHLGEDEHRLLKEAVESNWIAPIGAHIDAFEVEIAEKVGTIGAVALSSGTAAIHLALRLLGVSEGDRVFCSSFTFVASANPILYRGAVPVFIDSETTSWNMSPDALERALEQARRDNKLPKAVIVVNLYGQSALMDPIVDLCSAYKVPLLEDAAESLGAFYNGRPSGTFGYFGVYSFNGNKIITTSGGGMLVSDDLEALAKARFLSTQARDPAPHYQHSEMGYNYRLSNLLAAIGRGQLRQLENRVQARRDVFARYKDSLGSIEGLTFMPEIGRSTRWLTTMTIDSDTAGISTAEIQAELSKHNIESRPLWKPLHQQPLFFSNEYFPHQPNHDVSQALFQQGICLPSGSQLTIEQQDRVIDIIHSLTT